MSSDVAIRVNNLGKCYQIYESPRDRLKQFVLPKIKPAMGKAQKKYYREFWALKDVSFEVKKGEVVGIVGCNGSGKSTLLQMICGTLTPSSGSIETFGRVAALLELGAGFNSEFTGRENIYMNAAIHGLKRAEIEKQLSFILDFADIGDFIDQPVKTYSSGMYVRLAFAVAINVNPEILIIDEALAVGDARFQLKCYKHLEEIKKRGTTILFVSHSMEMVKSLCNIGLVLDKGRLVYIGNSKDATVTYMNRVFVGDEFIDDESSAKEQVNDDLSWKIDNHSGEYLVISSKDIDSHGQTFGVGGARLNILKIHGHDIPNLFVGGRVIRVVCEFEWQIEALEKYVYDEGYENCITVGIAIANNKGSPIFGCNGFDSKLPIDCLSKSASCVEFVINMPNLVEGDYFMTVAIALGNMNNHIQLKWYDCLVQIKCSSDNKNVFGVFAVDYNAKEIMYEDAL